MLEIEQTITTWPQLGSSVAHGGAATADAVRRISLGQSRQSGRFFLDLEQVASDGVAEPPSVAPRATSTRARPCTDPLIRNLVAQAVLAPSGGNTQPWRWVADGSEPHLFLDRTRTSGLIDFEYGGSYTALGCAAETLILAAQAANLEVVLESFPCSMQPEHVASFRLLRSPDSAAEPHWRDELYTQIPLRRTSRNFTTRRPVPPDDLRLLTEAVRSIAECNVQWLSDETSLAEVGDLLGIADRLRLLQA